MEGYLFLTFIIVETIIILVFLTIFLLQKRKSCINRRDALEKKIDFGNLINSAFNSENLYREMIRKCHPDRFPDDPQKIVMASEISGLIGKQKHNYKELLALKTRAEKELEIKI